MRHEADRRHDRTVPLGADRLAHTVKQVAQRLRRDDAAPEAGRLRIDRVLYFLLQNAPAFGNGLLRAGRERRAV